MSVCASCKAGDHSPYDQERLTGCRGGTWCDCQHRTDRSPVTAERQIAMGIPGFPSAKPDVRSAD